MRSGLTPIFAGGLLLATLLTIHVLPGLASVLLLVFAGTILAVLLDSLTTAIQHILPFNIHHRLAYGLTLLCLLLLIAAIGGVVGATIASQASQLVQRIPQAWAALINQIKGLDVVSAVSGNGWQPVHWFVSNLHITNLLGSTFGALFNICVVVLVGVYAAATPERYQTVSSYLLPSRLREQASSLNSELGRSLRNWVLGRLGSMAIIGMATGVGLWLLGVPLAFTLGLVAGLLSFVPYIGPILGLIPAVLVAALQSLMLAVWVLVLYAGVQLVETALLTPLIQQRAVSLPPVILISAQLVGGALIGPLGVLLAAPLVVCTLAAGRWYRKTEDETKEQVPPQAAGS